MRRSYSFIFILVLLLSGGLFAQSQSNVKVDSIFICTSVQNRQPVGTDSVFTSDVGKLYCFTKLSSESDTSEISHVWFYNNKQMAKINLPMNAKSWHTWSAKTIMPAWKGDWRVEIQDSEGNVISKISFRLK